MTDREKMYEHVSQMPQTTRTPAMARKTETLQRAGMKMKYKPLMVDFDVGK